MVIAQLLGCQEIKQCQEDATVTRPVTWNTKIEKFASCEELRKYQESLTPSWGKKCGGPIPYDSPASLLATNQVPGIGEGDLLQSNAKYFYFARPGSIEIVNKQSLKKHKSLLLPTLQRRWLILLGDSLIFIGTDSSTIGTQGSTQIYVFEEKNNFKLAYSKTLSGETLDFRTSDSTLTLVTKNWGIHSDDLPAACDNIYRPQIQNGSREIAFVTSIDFSSKPFKEQSLGLMGGADFISMTADELLLLTTGPVIESAQRSFFQVVKLSEPRLQVAQVQIFDGYIKDRWSVHQTENHLFLAVTGNESNKVIAFQRAVDGRYSWLSESPVFGPREDIRSVLYLEDKAYVVTFEKTDPLVILDLSQPEEMKILSELKSLGFSTQLTPLSGGFLGGLGYDTTSERDFPWFGGLNFSLYDVNNPILPTEVSRLRFGDRGSSSEATGEPKAFYRFEDQARVSIPTVLREFDQQQLPSEFAQKLTFAGTIILEASDGTVHERGRMTHKHWRDQTCGEMSSLRFQWWNAYNPSNDIQRTLEFDGAIYNFSRFGITKHDGNNLSNQGSLKYSNSKRLCDFP